MKKIFSLFLALTLAFSICIPAGAEYTDEYWEGYDEGLSQGYQDGVDAFENGGTPPVPTGTREDGYAAGYADGYSSGYYDAQWIVTDEEMAAERAEAFGGVPGKINVKLDGTCIDFGTVWPENQNGRVMAPMRTVLEAMGAQVEYDAASRKVTATLDERMLVHTVGTEVVEIYADGKTDTEPEIITMDCKSTTTGGRVMVPVRFFSEALGYVVEWDEYYQTVVLLDMKAMREAYNGKLSVLNLILSELQLRQETDKTYREDMHAELDLTLFDTIHGDTRMGAEADVSTLTGADAVNATIEVDLSDLVKQMQAEAEAAGGAGMEFVDQESLELLKRLSMDVIYNEKTQILYIKSPILDAVLGQNTWLEYPVMEEDPALGNFQQLLGWNSMGENGGLVTATDLIYWYAISSGYADPVFYYEILQESMEEAVEYLGDANFQKSGSSYTLKPQKLLEVLGAELYWYVAGTGDEWNLDASLRVTDLGDGRCTFAGGFSIETPEEEISLDFSSRAASGEINLAFHMKNQFTGTITATSTREVTDEAVETMPPASELSMDLDEIYS